MTAAASAALPPAQSTSQPNKMHSVHQDELLTAVRPLKQIADRNPSIKTNDRFT